MAATTNITLADGVSLYDLFVGIELLSVTWQTSAASCYKTTAFWNSEKNSLNFLYVTNFLNISQNIIGYNQLVLSNQGMKHLETLLLLFLTQAIVQGHGGLISIEKGLLCQKLSYTREV